MNLFRSTTTTLITSNSMNLSAFRRALFLIPLVLACFTFLPRLQAQLPSPAPDGGYPNGNTAEGDGALFNLTTGSFNTAVGSVALFSNTTADSNTAIGQGALFNNTTGPNNTAVGFEALVNNTTGAANTAVGTNALVGNTTGANNTAVGEDALFSDTTGDLNTAIGLEALAANTTGVHNTAVGSGALLSNITGVENTAVGNAALLFNTGDDNTATGYSALASETESNVLNGALDTADGAFALFSNTTGTANTAVGLSALRVNTTGNENTATGADALDSNTTGAANTANGVVALFNNTTGSFNIALGFAAGITLTTGDHNIDIGNVGVAGEANTIRIGNSNQTATYIAGISGAGVTGIAVKVNAAGQLGTPPSTARFKDDIRPMNEASEAILGLKPVTFRYKKEIDPERAPQFGLVAEDVAKVNPDLIARDAKGDVYTVRYDAVNAMLLNEFLKEHQKVKRLEAALAAVNKRLKAQDAKIDKVNAKLELTKPAPQVANNGQ